MPPKSIPTFTLFTPQTRYCILRSTKGGRLAYLAIYKVGRGVHSQYAKREDIFRVLLYDEGDLSSVSIQWKRPQNL